jgi:hypothetical protein
MQKLGIIREDVTPTEESSEKVAFECDDQETGEESIISRSEKKLDKEALIDSINA